jgi:D-alanyl-D-alanine carboxypeptidase
MLTLDEPLESWVPGVPNGTTITIRQLLNHTSGIYNYTDTAFFQQALSDPTYAWPPQELVDIAVQHGPDFDPGTDWSYSNTNYILIGMIVEQASGQSFEALVRERLLEPHGLDSTFLDGYETLGAELATAYAQNGQDVTDIVHMSVAWSAGAYAATASDVADWAAALYRGEVLAAPEMDAMLDMVPTSYAGVEYGLGVFGYGPSVLLGEEGIGHGGDIFGFHTFMVYMPEHDTAVVSIVNSDAANPTQVLGDALPLLAAP